MQIALVLAISLLALAAPVAVPSAQASEICSPTLDFAQACVSATDDCHVRVKFGGDRFCLP